MLITAPKAILWDMDGVLVDTSRLHIEAWKHVLTEYGIPFDARKFNIIFGLKNSEFIHYIVKKPIDEKSVKRIIDQKESYFRLKSYDLLPLPGVMNWLERFKSWGFKQAIASSGEASNVEYIVDVVAIREYFDALVTPGVLPGKPDPAVFLKASTELNIPANHCIVIEDSGPGIEAACKAGMRCIAIKTTNPPEMLSQANIVVETLDQLSVWQVESLLD